MWRCSVVLLHWWQFADAKIWVHAKYGAVGCSSPPRATVAMATVHGLGNCSQGGGTTSNKLQINATHCFRQHWAGPSCTGSVVRTELWMDVPGAMCDDDSAAGTSQRYYCADSVPAGATDLTCIADLTTWMANAPPACSGTCGNTTGELSCAAVRTMMTGCGSSCPSASKEFGLTYICGCGARLGRTSKAASVTSCAILMPLLLLVRN